MINALVLCGAIPVYVNPDVDARLGISLGMKREQVARAIRENPDAVAVVVNNPTYYGICSDLRSIVRMAHEAGMLCLADEAHGTHFYFGSGLPVSAMAAGADMAAISMHKSGGSLTQSSFLAHRAQGPCRLCAPDHQPDPDHLRQLPAHEQPGYQSSDVWRSTDGKSSTKWWIWRNTPGRKSTTSADTMPLAGN